MSEWFGKNCEYQCCQWEGSEYTAGPNYREARPSLIFCDHKANKDDCEGNCNETLCPLVIERKTVMVDDGYGPKDMSDMDNIFDGDNADVTSQIDEMAQTVCIEMGAVADLERQFKDRKESLEAMKGRLSQRMTEAGMQSCKLECGLTPRARTDRRIYKATGVVDDQLFDWLHKNDLGDIIKPTVHHGTLNSTMKAFEDQGNELPLSVFQVSERPTITMGGKSAFLAKKGSN